MLSDSRFWTGVVAASVTIYIYHHYVHPLPGQKKA